MYKRGYVLLCLDNKSSPNNMLEVINEIDPDIQKIYPSLSESMMNYLPPGTLVIKDALKDKDTGYITLPVFSSHFSLPIKEGEYVWFFEDNLSISEKNDKVVADIFPLLEIKNYWLSRIHGYSTCSEDVNYHNLERDAISINDLLSFNEDIDQATSKKTANRKASQLLKDDSKDKIYLPDHEKIESFQAVFGIDIDTKKGYDFYNSQDSISIDAIPTQYSSKHDLVLQGSNNTLLALTKDLSQNKGEINLVCGKTSLKDYVENHDDVLGDINQKIKNEYIKLPLKKVLNVSTGLKEIEEGTLLHTTFPEFENAYGQKEMLKVAKKYFKSDLEKEIKIRPDFLDIKSHEYDSSCFLMYMNTNLSSENFSDFAGITRLDKESQIEEINEITLGKTKTFDYTFANTREKDELEIDLEDIQSAIPSILMKSNDIQIVARKELKHIKNNSIIPDGSIKLIKDGYYRGQNKNSYSHVILERNGDILLDGKTINVGEYDREKLRLDIEEDDLMHGLGEGVVLGYDHKLSEPLVLGHSLNAILNEILLINVEALDHISKAFAEISSNFNKINTNFNLIQNHVHPVAGAVAGPSPPISSIGNQKSETVSIDSSSSINGGEEIKRLNDIIDNLYKILSRFSKTT